MEILYVSYDGMTDPLGQSQVIPYLIGLTKKGHHISIISSEKSANYKKNHSLIKSLLDSNDISWHPVPYSTSNSILLKNVNLKKLKKKAIQICKTGPPDIVHCRSYMSALIGIYLKQKFRLKFIFDMRGFWADERIDGGIWNPKNIIHKQIYKFFKKKEIAFLKNADYTISLTENAKNEILGWQQLRGDTIPIQVIPCCVDLDHFSPKRIEMEKKLALQKKLGINSEDFVVSYLGSIGTWYMLSEMLDFFKILLTKKTNSKFLFITQDDEQSIISLAATKGIPKNQLIIQSATRNEVPLHLSLSHLSLYFIKPLYSKKASSPTKTGEIMAMGIPIITNTGIGDSDQIINNSGTGKLIHHFNDSEYNKVVDQIDELLEIKKENIRDTSLHYFSLEKGVNDYHTVYTKIEQG